MDIQPDPAPQKQLPSIVTIHQTSTKVIAYADMAARFSSRIMPWYLLMVYLGARLIHSGGWWALSGVMLIVPWFILAFLVRVIVDIPSFRLEGLCRQTIFLEEKLRIEMNRHSATDLAAKLLAANIGAQRQVSAAYYRQLLMSLQTDETQLPVKTYSEYFILAISDKNGQRLRHYGWLLITPERLIFESDERTTLRPITVSLNLDKITLVSVGKGKSSNHDHIVIEYDAEGKSENFTMTPATRLTQTFFEFHRHDRVKRLIRKCLNCIGSARTFNPKAWETDIITQYLSEGRPWFR